MIVKTLKLLAGVATASQIPPEFMDYYHPQVATPIVQTCDNNSNTGVDWALGVSGFLLGAIIETGANMGAVQPCVGQVADIA